ncbi:MAG TPA: hypothetical protein PKA28_11475 [Methylomusa anaerophila]|uniref:Uncharacterized protein n=1 Tax=Methylomusa anaerophila TaxID=1930071 RepID=A0A348AJC9_9FIRM|nr:hypothetical protein [Methylomusa anaerophila]BBB91177.1 hypothetical protein MAMMFC1_01848 [Methylomusa anaerophila]HML89054.1 hypothetical protein [Methylomusa anaerophila]
MRVKTPYKKNTMVNAKDSNAFPPANQWNSQSTQHQLRHINKPKPAADKERYIPKDWPISWTR